MLSIIHLIISFYFIFLNKSTCGVSPHWCCVPVLLKLYLLCSLPDVTTFTPTPGEDVWCCDALLWLIIDVISCPFRMAHTWLSYCSQKAMRWVNKAVKHYPQHRFNSSDTLNVEMIEAYICQEIQTDSNIPSINYIQYACGMCVWTHKARKDWLISHPDETFYPKVTLLTGNRLLL